MPRARRIWWVVAALAVALAVSSTASADPEDDSLCSDAAVAWAARAAARMKKDVTAVACPGDLVRLHVENADCDFEVTRAGGFRRTASGKLGVSPIANLEWSTASPATRDRLDELLVALDADPSLLDLSHAHPAPPRGPAKPGGGSIVRVVGVVAGVLIAVFAVLARLYVRRRRAAR